MLKEKHQLAFQQLASRVCEERGIPLLEVSTASEHIHLLFSLKPTQSAASAVRELKGRTGLDLMSAFPELRVWLGGNLAWDEHYAVETVSPARLDRVRSGLRTRHASQDLGLARAS